MLLTVKSNLKTLHRQIDCQFQGKRHIPFTATDHEKRHGRDTVWELRAREAPEPIMANWPGCIVVAGPVRPRSPVRCRGWRPGGPMRCVVGISAASGS